MADIKQKAQNRNRSNMFGSFPTDPNRKDISGWQNYFLTVDATDTPVTSPATVAANADTLLQVPEGATELVISSSAALRINDASPASAPYFVIPSGVVMRIPCSSPTNQPNTNSGTFYLRSDSGSATVQFMFLCV